MVTDSCCISSDCISKKTGATGRRCGGSFICSFYQEQQKPSGNQERAPSLSHWAIEPTLAVEEAGKAMLGLAGLYSGEERETEEASICRVNRTVTVSCCQPGSSDELKAWWKRRGDPELRVDFMRDSEHQQCCWGPRIGETAFLTSFADTWNLWGQCSWLGPWHPHCRHHKMVRVPQATSWVDTVTKGSRAAKQEHNKPRHPSLPRMSLTDHLGSLGYKHLGRGWIIQASGKWRPDKEVWVNDVSRTSCVATGSLCCPEIWSE